MSPTFRDFLEPLESTIRIEYLASLTGRCISDFERSLLHLPARLGGPTVCNPCLTAEHSFESTSEQVKPVVDYILDPESTTLEDTLAAQSECVANAREQLLNDQMLHAEDVFQGLSQRGQRAMELRSKVLHPGSWHCSSPPMLFLSLKASFAILCACGKDGLRKTFQLTALTVSLSRLSTLLAAPVVAMSLFVTNELRDLFADLLRETSTNISGELQPLSGEVFH